MFTSWLGHSRALLMGTLNKSFIFLMLTLIPFFLSLFFQLLCKVRCSADLENLMVVLSIMNFMHVMVNIYSFKSRSEMDFGDYLSVLGAWVLSMGSNVYGDISSTHDCKISVLASHTIHSCMPVLLWLQSWTASRGLSSWLPIYFYVHAAFF